MSVDRQDVLARIPTIRCKTCGVIYSPMCEHMRYPNHVGEAGEGFAVVPASALEGAEEALLWIAEYDERDGRRIDDPSEAKSCIARNWLDAHRRQS